MAKLEKDLQMAILSMPQKDKDKLLLRLVAKDVILVQQLQFTLVEEGITVEFRRDEVKTAIDKLYRLDAMSSGYLMMDMRYLNSEITRHVKVTKDKYGEVELTMKLLKDCFEKQLKWISKYNSKTDTLTNYVVKRTDFLLKKLVKLHPDIQFDFYSDVNLLLENIYSNGTSFYAVQMGLPKVFEISESE
ncbi:hypothetical protein VB796_07000 [Arcicella sp. LKC2W]|uniref:hypothetical protein n=1 Tax=Arcicella sp. LKC2W TaxID=2984198 RepID=UPI002B219E5E|nr:hypothetical protein [Arcicella sp. LKC2W]MEA5458776.1 hypothetical protein [Arcicella sp. LKC2W]